MPAGLVIAFVAIVLALVFAVVGPRMRGAPVGGDVIVRCRQGHLFTTLWIPLASLKAVRLGWVRFQRCPVGHHWSLVIPVNQTTLTPADISFARTHRDVPMP